VLGARYRAWLCACPGEEAGSGAACDAAVPLKFSAAFGASADAMQMPMRTVEVWSILACRDDGSTAIASNGHGALRCGLRLVGFSPTRLIRPVYQPKASQIGALSSNADLAKCIVQLSLPNDVSRGGYVDIDLLRYL
jgi:hypothetical protein